MAEKVAQKLAVSIRFDTVVVEFLCGDQYAAEVLYEDLIDRLSKGEGITLSVTRPEKIGGG